MVPMMEDARYVRNTGAARLFGLPLTIVVVPSPSFLLLKIGGRRATRDLLSPVEGRAADDDTTCVRMFRAFMYAAQHAGGISEPGSPRFEDLSFTASEETCNAHTLIWEAVKELTDDLEAEKTTFTDLLLKKVVAHR